MADICKVAAQFLIMSMILGTMLFAVGLMFLLFWCQVLRVVL